MHKNPSTVFGFSYDHLSSNVLSVTENAHSDMLVAPISHTDFAFGMNVPWSASSSACQLSSHCRLCVVHYLIPSNLSISNSVNSTPRLYRTKVKVPSRQLTVMKYSNSHRFSWTQLYWNLSYSEEAIQSMSVKAAQFISKFTCHDRHWQTK